MFLKLNESAANFAGGPTRFELQLWDDQLGQIGAFDQNKTPIVLPDDLVQRIRDFAETEILPVIAAQTGMAVELTEPPPPSNG